MLLYLYFIYFFNCIQDQKIHIQLSLNGHLYKKDTSLKRTPRFGPCISLLCLVDS